MSQRAFVLSLLALLFGSGVAAVALMGKLQLPTYPAAQARHDSASPGKEPATASQKSKVGELVAALTPPGKAEQAAPEKKPPEPQFDVVRIDPEGVSVMAGRAEPLSTVHVISEGRVIASTTTDTTGSWSVATEHKFKDADPQLKLSMAAPSETKPSDNKTADANAKPDPTTESVDDVRKKLLSDLKSLVEQSKRDAQGTKAAAGNTDTAAPGIEPARIARNSATDTTTDAAGSTQARTSAGASATVASIPIPILFEFRTANFTSDGKRAAGMLLEYLKSESLNDITLTGHADERGTETLNLNLSRDRLETVRSYLKSGGFSGDVTLIAKGESAPFTGIDRTKYSGEELWQLDRRVELIINR